MSQRIFGLGSAAVICAALLFSSGTLFAEKPAPREHLVKIVGMVFVPKVIHVAPGEAVTWVNEDIVPHGIKPKNEEKGWQSGLLQPHQSWTRVVTEGVNYICPYHPTMEGEILVDAPKS